MRVAIANFGRPFPSDRDFRSYWARHPLPSPRPPTRLFDHAVDWGFHIYALGIHLRALGRADHVEFWDYATEPSTAYHSNGVLRVMFANPEDVAAYVDRHGPPDLFVNHGRGGLAILEGLRGRSFRVHVPALTTGTVPDWKSSAECFLVDRAEDLDERSMLYVPVVHTAKIRPGGAVKQRDFVYLAAAYPGKRHDLLLDAVRGTELTGHLHPVDGTLLDLRDTRVTTSNWNERAVVGLLQTSRIAVYPGDRTSNPAAMWECVAAGLPIVVSEAIAGGKHLVVSGVTGEIAPEGCLVETMRAVLDDLDSYRPRQHFEEHWDTIATLDRYLDFFAAMGWKEA